MGNRRRAHPRADDPHNESTTAQRIGVKFLLPDNLLPLNKPAQNVEMRGLSFIPVVIVLTEKEAEICFRFIEGRMDYAGFYGNDETFREWTRDLFLHYWDKGMRYPVPKME